MPLALPRPLSAAQRPSQPFPGRRGERARSGCPAGRGMGRMDGRGQLAWLTVDMLKSGTRTAGITVR
ncbi:hypothetical protein GCM10022224_012670 [Nonomuraea antimicrobica]|uniref:Uncharacterized protein n=1 Tax=Nonomuraea antimicrobica TaxID=561173 RepID=A0ABP7B6S8_9ACTN